MNATSNVPREASPTAGVARVLSADGRITVIVGTRDICDCFADGRCLGPEDLANSRRLAAAWNVVEGISTAEVERMVEAGHFARLAALERQRDDVGQAARNLLNVMESSVGRNSAYHDIAEAIRTLRKQLEKVKV